MDSDLPNDISCCHLNFLLLDCSAYEVTFDWELIASPAQVDVDVYRRAPVRTEPLPGATSFFQEELQKMRELHTTSDFLQAASALNPITQTLPQLIHHKVCSLLNRA